MPDVAELDYLEESGPGIPELPAAAPQSQLPPGDPLAEPAPKWERDTVEQFLKGTGAGVHMLWGVAESDWKMTETDLERIAPPLTRICNRYEPLLRLAPVADPLLVAHGFALYGWRSALERQRALRDSAAGQTPAEGERYERTEEAAPLAPEEAAVLDELQSESYFPPNGGGQ